MERLRAMVVNQERVGPGVVGVVWAHDGPAHREHGRAVLVDDPMERNHSHILHNDPDTPGVRSDAGTAQGSNGPLPIWSRTVVTGGVGRGRRCQLAPSTTRVWPLMNRA